MPQFTARPVSIEAVQLRWATWNDVCALIERHGGRFGKTDDAWKSDPTIAGPGRYIDADEVSDTCGEPGSQYIAIDVPTMHGERATVRHGDWLVPDGKPGTFYPIKPDVFARKYHPVDEAVGVQSDAQLQAVKSLLLERHRQDAAHGGASHDDTHAPEDWTNLRANYEGRALESDADARRDALVKIAALAVAQIEAHDRRQQEIRQTIDQLAAADEPKQITAGGE